MKDKQIYQIIAIISLICIIFSIIIYIEKIQLSTNKQDFCSAITGTNGCETVQTSKYSKTFGISNPVYGITGFALLEIFALLLIFREQKISRYLKIIKYLTVFGGIIAGLVALSFLYLQIFVLHTYCIFCLVVDISSLTLFGITIYTIIKMIRHK